jgi:hypothetical protein
VDLRVPATPSVLGRVTLPGGPFGLKVSGSLVYVAAGGSGLAIVDVSSLTAPRIIGSVDTPGVAREVAIANGYAYVADDTDVQVVDVHTPTSPLLVASLAVTARDVAISGTRLYAASTGTFTVADVTNPRTPTVLSTVNSMGAVNLDVSGSIAFTVSVDPTTAGLYVWNVASGAPSMLAHLFDPYQGWRVTVSGSLGCVGGTSGLRVMDVSIPSAPRILGSLAGNIAGLTMSGQFAYALVIVPGNPSHTDLAVVDLRVPATPAILGSVTLPGGPLGVKVSGSLAYVAAGGSGLVIVDVSTLTAPRIVGSVDTPGVARQVALGNGYAYVADDTAVRVIDVHTPSTPLLVASLAASALDVAVSGTRLYAVSAANFTVADVTNPATPAILSTTSSNGAVSVGVAGTLAFLVTPHVSSSVPRGIMSGMDVSIPSRPTLVEQLLLPGSTNAVVAATTPIATVFAADDAATIDIVQ